MIHVCAQCFYFQNPLFSDAVFFTFSISLPLTRSLALSFHNEQFRICVLFYWRFGAVCFVCIVIYYDWLACIFTARNTRNTVNWFPYFQQHHIKHEFKTASYRTHTHVHSGFPRDKNRSEYESNGNVLRSLWFWLRSLLCVHMLLFFIQWEFKIKFNSTPRVNFTVGMAGNVSHTRYKVSEIHQLTCGFYSRPPLCNAEMWFCYRIAIVIYVKIYANVFNIYK